MSDSYVTPISPQPANPKQDFYIEMVTVCVGYADILAHTLPLNLLQVDRIICVTEPEDKKTQRLCDYYGVQVELVDTIGTRWGQFCKANAINHGFSKLRRKGWVLHADSDIILPPHFKKTIQEADLDTTMIYGCDRAEFKSFDDWQRFHQEPEPQIQGGGFFIHVENYGQRLGTRVAFPHHGGYIPIGFFQLFHKDSGNVSYPTGHTDAGRDDSVFAAHNWPRRKRGFLPEIIVAHLESEAAEMGINWRGRKSKKFGIWNEKE